MLTLPSIGGFAVGTSFARHSHTTSTATTLTAPATIQDGDIGVWMDVAYSTSSGALPTNVLPTGWTTVAAYGSSSFPYALMLRGAIKRLVSGDAGATITGISNASHSVLKQLVVFRATPAPTSIAASGNVDNGDRSGASPISVSVSATGATPVTLLVAGYFQETAPTRTLSTSYVEELANGTSYIRWQNYPSGTTPVNTTVTTTGSGTLKLAWGTYINLT